MKYYFFVNSISNINKNRLITAAKEYFSEFEIFYSEYPKHIETLVETELKKNIHEKITAIVIGGDGTLNEACNGIVSSNHENVFLGYIPTGTANVIAHEFFIPNDIEKCFKIIKANNWRDINLSKAGDRYFLFSCGIGFDGNVVKNLNLSLKRKIGKFAFVLSGLNVLKNSKKFSEFRVIIDNEEHICTSIIISRIKRYAGDFKLFKKAYIFSDYFEIALFNKVNMFEILKFFSGVKSEKEFRIGKKIKFSEKYNIPVQLDGEYLDGFPEVIEITDKKVKFILP